MSTTTIEWTDRVWNPTTGCHKVSPGCKHCYAEGIAKRFWKTQYPPVDGRPREFADVQTHADRLTEPLSWRKPCKVFVNSMSDLFEESVPFEFIAAVFAVMAYCDHHIYQVLTKRPARMREFMEWVNAPEGSERINELYGDRAGQQVTMARMHRVDESIAMNVWAEDDNGVDLDACLHNNGVWPPENVWLGVSVENQQYADERIPLLLQTPAAVRFISYEPALGPIDLSPWIRGNCGRTEERRRQSVSGGGVGPTRSRRPWAHLEDSAKAEAGGEAIWRLPAGPRHAERDQASRAGAPVGVATLQGSDPGRIDGQPRERPQATELAGQPDASDQFGAGNSRAASPWSLSTGRGAEQSREVDPGIRGGDSETAIDGRGAEVDRGIVQRQRQDNLEDRARPTLDWIICGGESGPGARQCELWWIRNIIGQCRAADVPVFVKQLGSHPIGWWSNSLGPAINRHTFKDRKCGDMTEWPEDLRVRQFPEARA